LKNQSFASRMSVCVFGIAATMTPAFGSIIYSGPENLVLQGVPGTIQSLTIHLAGDPGSWDTLQLTIAGADTNDIFPGAGVALASPAATFPAVTEFADGDPYPSNPVFGSGSEFLWSPFITGGFTDGSIYAADLLGTQGGGPAYSGWIRLDIQNVALPTATITVLDWAYSKVVGQTISIGQVAPEPSTLSLSAFYLESVL
jgi:hypothetical protein